MTNSIRQQLKWASNTLYSISCSARLDSEVLLAFCLRKNRSYLMTWPDQELTGDQIDRFHNLVQRRVQPQPVAYLTGSREFYSMELNTTPATLVPRPETELLVDTVLKLIQYIESPNILELGTGNGAIALALKKHKPMCQVLATDISQQSLHVAKSNALKHRLDIDFVQSDWHRKLSASSQYDIIVSNPPYIAADDPYLSQGDLAAEPRLALCSGETGLEAMISIIAGAGRRLKPAGWIVLEHGYEQSHAVTDLLFDAKFINIATYRDINDLPRMCVGQRCGQ